MLTEFERATRSALIKALGVTKSRDPLPLAQALPSLDYMLLYRITGYKLEEDETYEQVIDLLPNEQRLAVAVANFLIAQWLFRVFTNRTVSLRDIELYIEELESPLTNLQAAVDWYHTITRA